MYYVFFSGLSFNFFVDIIFFFIIRVLIRYIWLSFLIKEIKRLVCVIWLCEYYFFGVLKFVKGIEGEGVFLGFFFCGMMYLWVRVKFFEVFRFRLFVKLLILVSVDIKVRYFIYINV